MSSSAINAARCSPRRRLAHTSPGKDGLALPSSSSTGVTHQNSIPTPGPSSPPGHSVPASPSRTPTQPSSAKAQRSAVSQHRRTQNRLVKQRSRAKQRAQQQADEAAAHQGAATGQMQAQQTDVHNALASTSLWSNEQAPAPPHVYGFDDCSFATGSQQSFSSDDDSRSTQFVDPAAPALKAISPAAYAAQGDALDIIFCPQCRKPVRKGDVDAHNAKWHSEPPGALADEVVPVEATTTKPPPQRRLPLTRWR